MLRPLEEFLWVLRRHGIAFGPAQAADAARAVALLGWDDRWQVREALALVVLRRPDERGRFDALFDEFFQADKAHRRDLAGRLVAQGFDPEVVRRLRELLGALAEGDPGELGEGLRRLLGLVHRPALDEQLAAARAMLQGPINQRQVGYFAQQAMGKLGVLAASQGVGKLAALLEAEFGAELGQRLGGALRRELELARSEVRLFVEQEAQRREAPAPGRALGGLTLDEVGEVRRAVRVLGERLRGAARVRARRSMHGRVDAHRTLRAAARTGGVPVRLVHRKKQRRRPRLWVLCDVSDSVRATAVFLLEFMAVAQELFERTRTFVFVSDVAETTALFEREPLERALGAVLGGGVVSVARDSNYGRALRGFEARFGRELDRRATVVVVGDGRTNYQDPGLDALERLRERARAVLWLCPEPQSRWGTGDSAMPRYARAVTQVLMATTAQELEGAARALVRGR